jgi:hypothetical protein
MLKYLLVLFLNYSSNIRGVLPGAALGSTNPSTVPITTTLPITTTQLITTTQPKTTNVASVPVNLIVYLLIT